MIEDEDNDPDDDAADSESSKLLGFNKKLKDTPIVDDKRHIMDPIQVILFFCVSI